MNSSNGPSKQDKTQKVNNPAPASAIIIPKENELEIPPKYAIVGISENEMRENEKNGEIILASAGNGKVYENGTLDKQDGDTITMINPKVYQTLLATAKHREEIRNKAKQKQKTTENRVQASVGTDRGE